MNRVPDNISQFRLDTGGQYAYCRQNSRLYDSTGGPRARCSQADPLALDRGRPLKGREACHVPRRLLAHLDGRRYCSCPTAQGNAQARPRAQSSSSFQILTPARTSTAPSFGFTPSSSKRWWRAPFCAARLRQPCNSGNLSTRSVRTFQKNWTMNSRGLPRVNTRGAIPFEIAAGEAKCPKE